MTRFFGILFLVGLGLSSANLPQRLNNLLSVSTVESAVQQKTVMGSQLPEGLDHTDQRYINDMAPTVELHMNPLTEAMLRIPKNKESNGALESLSFDWRKWIANHRFALQAAAVRIPAALLALGMLLHLIGAKGPGRFCIGFCHALAQKWLFLLSLSATGFFVFGKFNLWALLPMELWMAPVAALLGSVALLSWIDMNYPTWNSAVSSFSAPIAACVVIFLWDKARPFIPF